MFECRGCGAVVRGRAGRVFCSNTCQRSHERRARVEAWWETGHAFVASAPDHYVRAHLRAEQGARCAICLGPDMWRGKTLVLVLDHVNGDPEDNRRGNLRLVCPNCDSQLLTYKNRNRGRGRHARRQRYADGSSY